MAHHKRKRPKHRRAGCLLCKPHKDERMPKRPRNKKALMDLADSNDSIRRHPFVDELRGVSHYDRRMY